jgi:predicted O-methyltransferase YrrM
MSAQLTMTAGLSAYLASINSEPGILSELRDATGRDPFHDTAVAPITARCLQAIVKMTKARKVCEVGVYTGYSSLAIALALADEGRLWCFDINPVSTSIARRYWRRAGVENKIRLELGDGALSMRRLIDEGHGGTFDLVFIDADKSAYGLYWDLAQQLLRQHGVVVADNTLLQAAVGPEWTDERLAEKWGDLKPQARAAWIRATHDIRVFNTKVHHDARFDVLTLPIGDGITLGVKT